MADTIALDNSTSGAVSASSTSFSFTVTTGTILVVSLGLRDSGAGSPTVTSVTYGGQTLTSLVEAVNSSGGVL